MEGSCLVSLDGDDDQCERMSVAEIGVKILSELKLDTKHNYMEIYMGDRLCHPGKRLPRFSSPPHEVECYIHAFKTAYAREENSLDPVIFDVSAETLFTSIFEYFD
jgi:hypothetical protein